MNTVLEIIGMAMMIFGFGCLVGHLMKRVGSKYPEVDRDLGDDGES